MGFLTAPNQKDAQSTAHAGKLNRQVIPVAASVAVV